MTNKISNLISASLRNKHKILSAYIMPGFPDYNSTFKICRAAMDAGVDFIELGIPFSDPLADGVVIQKSAQVAIGNGITPRKVLEIADEVTRKFPLPVIAMGYYNSFLNGIGHEFMSELARCGVSGLIIPDLSYEESSTVAENAKANEISLVMLIAPTSDDERIKKISQLSSDFCYCVSVTGVTGVRKSLVTEEVRGFLQRVRKNSLKPFVVGFGISNPESAREISLFSDGIVVGSALLERVSADGGLHVYENAYEFLKSLRDAL
ncbi:MAG: tryptophan synthase subunit alpha [Candidatus Kryptoniota bacterium]